MCAAAAAQAREHSFCALADFSIIAHLDLLAAILKHADSSASAQGSCCRAGTPSAKAGTLQQQRMSGVLLHLQLAAQGTDPEAVGSCLTAAGAYIGLGAVAAAAVMCACKRTLCRKLGSSVQLCAVGWHAWGVSTTAQLCRSTHQHRQGAGQAPPGSSRHKAAQRVVNRCSRAACKLVTSNSHCQHPRSRRDQPLTTPFLLFCLFYTPAGEGHHPPEA